MLIQFSSKKHPETKLNIYFKTEILTDFSENEEKKPQNMMRLIY